MLDVDAEATDLRGRAGYDDEDVPGALALAKALGVVIRRVDPSLLRGSAACLIRLHGRPEIFIRRKLSHERTQWTVAHELAELRLQEIDYRGEDVEQLADAMAAAILMPLRPYRGAARLHGALPAALAHDFLVDQTAATLRLAEVHAVEAAVVVTPGRVYARGPEEWVLPPERDIRRGMLGRMPGVRSILLTDAQRRVAFVAA